MRTRGRYVRVVGDTENGFGLSYYGPPTDDRRCRSVVRRERTTVSPGADLVPYGGSECHEDSGDPVVSHEESRTVS